MKEIGLIGYASGNFGKNVLWAFVDVTLLYILTDHLEIAPELAGAIFAASLLLGAGVDLGVGYLADRVAAKRWRYGRFILLGAPLCALSFVTLYALASWDVRDPVILGIALCAFRCSFALIDLPHNALIARVSTSSRGRSRAAGYRFIFSSLASLAVAFTVPSITSSGSESQRALFAFALLAGLLSAVTMVGSWWSVRKFDSGHLEPLKPHQAIYIPLDAHILILAGIVVLTGLAAPLFAKMSIYFSKYILLSQDMVSVLLTALICGQLAGAVLWSWLSQYWEKSHILAFAHSLCAISFLLIWGIGPYRIEWAESLTFFIGVGLSGVFLLPWAIAPDLIDFSEYRHKVRHEAAIFATLILLLKLSVGLGSAMVGWTLAWAGYLPDVEQPANVENWILALTLGIPALGSAICAILALRVKATHHTHKLIVERLSRRKTSHPYQLENS